LEKVVRRGGRNRFPLSPRATSDERRLRVPLSRSHQGERLLSPLFPFSQMRSLGREERVKALFDESQNPRHQLLLERKREKRSLYGRTELRGRTTLSGAVSMFGQSRERLRGNEAVFAAAISAQPILRRRKRVRAPKVLASGISPFPQGKEWKEGGKALTKVCGWPGMTR